MHAEENGAFTASRLSKYTDVLLRGRANSVCALSYNRRIDDDVYVLTSDFATLRMLNFKSKHCFLLPRFLKAFAWIGFIYAYKHLSFTGDAILPYYYVYIYMAYAYNSCLL